MPKTDLPLQAGTSPGEIAERELVPGTPPPMPPSRAREENEQPRDRDVEPPPESKSEE